MYIHHSGSKDRWLVFLSNGKVYTTKISNTKMRTKTLQNSMFLCVLGNVICAITKNGPIGVDIELLKELNIEDFINTMTLSQWKGVRNSKNPLKSFYKLWVVKESIIKADGRGLSIPLNKIKPKNSMFKYDGTVWYLRELLFDNKNIRASLASSQPIDKINFIRVDFTSFIV